MGSRLWVALAALAVSGVAQQPADTRQPDPNIVQRFVTRPDPPLTRYRAARRLEARNDRFHVTGWLEACTELSPDAGFQYRVLAEGGNTLIRKRVLRKALETEWFAVAQGEIARSRIGPENYEFRPADGAAVAFDPQLAKLLITPRRKSRMLVDGAIFVARRDADLVRVEGQLALNPSFWTRRVRVARRYERVAGAHVPVAFESTAEIRIAGPSTFRMTYRYLSINGQDLPASGPPCTVGSG